MTLAPLSPIISLFLIPMLVASPGWPQSALASGSPLSDALQIVVIEGDSSSVVAGSRSNRGFYVQVTDANGVGVADAAVALRLPDSGTSGLFADGSHSAVVYTDASGRAHVEGVQWNTSPGVASIRITASKGDQHAGMLLEQKVFSAAAKDNPAAPQLQAAIPMERAVPSAAAKTEDVAPLNTIGPPADAVPVRPALRAAAPGVGVAILRSAEPSVSISTDGAGPAYHAGFNKKKWILIGLAIVAGAGAAYAASGLMKTSSSTAGSSSISIGAPTVSVGHP